MAYLKFAYSFMINRQMIGFALFKYDEYCVDWKARLIKNVINLGSKAKIHSYLKFNGCLLFNCIIYTFY